MIKHSKIFGIFLLGLLVPEFIINGKK